ncbi:hypothetical protein ACFL20_04285 [Spirochaetota bacterium]
MRTYTDAKPFTEDPDYNSNREKALRGFDPGIIDEPIADIINGFAGLSYCYTLQSCFGHFVHGEQRDLNNIEPLSGYDENSRISYRIAYLAFCIENSDNGRKLYCDLEKVPRIDPGYIQFGSAGWFWRRCKNTYVLQVEPEKDKNKDKTIVNIQEALHLEKVKLLFFDKLRDILK